MNKPMNKPNPKLEYRNGRPSVLRKPTVWRELNFYKRSEILYQLTVSFCRRFLPKYGDRTVDQMIQAARSTKQNIIEGYSDGQTSFEIEMKLLGVARGSNQELLEDYHDYLAAHGLREWKGVNTRFDALHRFCREKTALGDFQPFFGKWSDDEMANCAICLSHMIDKGLATTLEKKDEEFVTQGGIKERMAAARLGYRTDQRERISALERENADLRRKVERLEAALAGKTGLFGKPGNSGASGLSGKPNNTPPHWWKSGVWGVESPVPDGGNVVMSLAHKRYDKIETGLEHDELCQKKSYWDERLGGRKGKELRSVTFMRGHGSPINMTWEVLEVDEAKDPGRTGFYVIRLGKRIK